MVDLFWNGRALLVYILWQWLIIGAVPEGAIQNALSQGLPATAALESLTGKTWIIEAGRYFAFFAVITSMLGVAFSMVDFLGDGLKMSRTGWSRGLFNVFDLFTAICADDLGSRDFRDGDRICRRVRRGVS